MNQSQHQTDTRGSDADESKHGGWLDRAASRTRARVQQHPLRAVGGAFAAGFVLGNFLPKAVGKAVALAGVRLVISRARAHYRERHAEQT